MHYNSHIPTYGEKIFQCPFCGVIAQFFWGKQPFKWHGYDIRKEILESDVSFFPIETAKCTACDKQNYWCRISIGSRSTDWKMIYPEALPIKPPTMLPENCKKDYEEASSIHMKSPRAACAFLRCCLQNLCVYLGKPGKNLNTDIAQLVKDGMPPNLQKSADIIRILGNNAVHPGEINTLDTQETVTQLFQFIDLIVQYMIKLPTEISTVYEALPENKRNAIETRDSY